MHKCLPLLINLRILIISININDLLELLRSALLHFKLEFIDISTSN
jgi:hypothetical protein